jgi:4-hydroxy-4-methyl-2-oxoglutarate aldolase
MELSSASVHEAAGRTGALPSAIKPVVPRAHLAAPAFPVRCPPGDNLWLHRAIQVAPPGAVLVVATDDTPEYGYWGEILTAAAMQRELAGLIIDGGVRDADRLAECGWPVFASRVCIRGTAKDPDAEGSVGETISIREVPIAPGDLVVADSDGVVVVPAADAEQVVIATRERDAREVDYRDRIRAGESTLTIYGLPPGADDASVVAGQNGKFRA